MPEVYLDNNATTKPLPAVREAMLQVLGDEFGNPSSSHSGGNRARVALREARGAVARLVDQIVFTGSGTEANNLVLVQLLQRVRAGADPLNCRLVTTSIEHSSILRCAAALETLGIPVTILPVGRTGQVDVADVTHAIDESVALVSVQWVNNETGVIQPVEEIARLCREKEIPFHTDAAQALGKLSIEGSEVAADFLTVTAHKLHGPQGVGAVCARNLRDLQPIGFGGNQERGVRPGTENVPGIVGFGAAADHRAKSFDDYSQSVGALRDAFESNLMSKMDGIRINGASDHRVANSSNLLFDGVDGQALVAQLDQVGIRCSQSSACTNQRPEPSYVLRAMGLSEEEAYSSLRFSFSETNTKEEVDYAVGSIVKICNQQRSFWSSIGRKTESVTG